MFKALRKSVVEMERGELREIKLGAENIMRYAQGVIETLDNVMSDERVRRKGSEKILQSEGRIRMFLREILRELHHEEDLTKSIVKEELMRERG